VPTPVAVGLASIFNVATVPMPAETVVGCFSIVGEGQVAESVTTPVALLAPIVLQLFATWTQYAVIVETGVTVTDELVALGIGLPGLPDVPVYHW
jgi:hypothetical protein